MEFGQRALVGGVTLAAMASVAFVANTSAAPSGKELLAAARCGPRGAGSCPGAPIPAVRLENVQPATGRAGRFESLRRFRGRPTVIALLASW